MKMLHYIHARVLLAYYGWAEREIDKMHADLPRIVVRRLELRDKLARLHA